MKNTLKHPVLKALLPVVLISVAATYQTPARAGSDPFVGEIMYVGFNFCPRGWAEADGQLLSISENITLFSLYGTTYGGNGETTFALPDLRGRVPVHTGQGPGLSNYPQGQKGGAESVNLSANDIPPHAHGPGTLSGKIIASKLAGDTEVPDGNMPANGQRAAVYGADPGAADHVDMAGGTVAVSAGTTASTGGGLSHENRPPYLVIRACVALTGLYPSRS